MRKVSALALALLASSPARASDPPPASSPSAPLAFYVGEWDQTGEVRPDAKHPFQPLTGHQSCDWFEHGASVVCHEVQSLPRGGSANGLYILTWNDTAKAYTITGSDYVSGGVLSGPGVVEDGIWKWDLRLAIGGTNIHKHYRYSQIGPDERTLEVEVNAVIVQRVTFRRVR